MRPEISCSSLSSGQVPRERQARIPLSFYWWPLVPPCCSYKRATSSSLVVHASRFRRGRSSDSGVSPELTSAWITRVHPRSCESSLSICTFEGRLTKQFVPQLV